MNEEANRIIGNNITEVIAIDEKYEATIFNHGQIHVELYCRDCGTWHKKGSDCQPLPHVSACCMATAKPYGIVYLYYCTHCQKPCDCIQHKKEHNE